MPDFFGVYDDMKVIEYLEFFASAYRIKGAARRKICEEVLELVDLTYKRDALVTSLSRGMTQRLGLARTLLHDPQVLLLDEPASGLDPRARIEMRALLKELRSMGKTILVSSHILPELADICNKIGIIEQGKLLVNGEVTEVMKQVRTDIVLNIAVSDRLTDAANLLEGPARGRERRGQERRAHRQAPRGGQPVRLPRQPADQPGIRADPLQGRRDQPRDGLHAPDQGDHELTDPGFPAASRLARGGLARLVWLLPPIVGSWGHFRMRREQPAKYHLYREVVQATWLGLVVNLALGCAKLVGGLVGQSYALISDAVNSLGDVFTSVGVLLAFRVAQKPADAEHPYGHTRAEAIAGSNIAILVGVSALLVGLEAIRGVSHHPHEIPPVWTLAIAGANVLIKEALYQYQTRLGRRAGRARSSPMPGTTVPTPSAPWPSWPAWR